MNDTELQDIVLRKYYEKRRQGLVQLSPSEFDDQIDQADIFRISGQLAERGLIQFKGLKGDDTIVAGMGQILEPGIRSIETRSMRVPLTS